jgi:lysophospholipase
MPGLHHLIMTTLFSTPRNPVPTGAVCATFEGVGGVPIRYARWAATAERRLGTVCLFGGRGEYIEKYFETIADLRRRGFAVATMDWRGQGGSGRLLKSAAKGHARTFSDHDEDVRRFMRTIVLPDCPPPYFCLAHSMGGQLILRHLTRKSCWWDRVVLSAPLMGYAGSDAQNHWRCFVARAAALFGMGRLYIPGGRANSPEGTSFDDNKLTSDRSRFDTARDILRSAPQLGIGSPTLGWVAAACASFGKVRNPEFMERIAVPILIVAAGNDEIASTNASEVFASRLKLCTRIVIAGAKHEIMQERDEFRDQFWAAFDAFVPGSNVGDRRLEPV